MGALLAQPVVQPCLLMQVRAWGRASVSPETPEHALRGRGRHWGLQEGKGVLRQKVQSAAAAAEVDSVLVYACAAQEAAGHAQVGTGVRPQQHSQSTSAMKMLARMLQMMGTSRMRAI